MILETVPAMEIQSLPTRRDSAVHHSRQASVEEIVELKTEDGEIIMPIVRPWSQPSDEQPLRPARLCLRVGHLLVLGLSNSGFREPAPGPRKAAIGIIQRALTQPHLDLWALIAARHAQLVERAWAEWDTLIVDVLPQFLAGHQRLRR
jgi:hypothetical protein